MIETQREYVFGTERELREAGFDPAADERNRFQKTRRDGAFGGRADSGFVDRERMREPDAKMDADAAQRARSANKNRATQPRAPKSRRRAANARARQARRVAR